MTRIRGALAAALAVALSASAAAQPAGRLGDPRLSEISGLAVSSRNPDVIWGVNDSGHDAMLYAFDPTGRALGRRAVARARNVDWEDLAAFTLDGEAYLLIADTGDNRATRRLVWLYIVAEPPTVTGDAGNGGIVPVARIPFRFADGARDCEAVSVDVAGDRILLVSKREVPAAIYELPLTLAGGIAKPLVARRVGTVADLPAPLRGWGPQRSLRRWQHQPTAMDIAADGRTIALLTYRNVYLYERRDGAGWANALAGAPRILPLPGLAQYESLAFAGDQLYVVAEGAGAELVRLRWSDRRAARGL